MPFCPVLIEIVDEELKKCYKGNYLLQVWNSKGEKVFNMPLEYEINCWNIFYDYFLFQLHPDERDSNFIYIVKLHRKCAILKV